MPAFAGAGRSQEVILGRAHKAPPWVEVFIAALEATGNVAAAARAAGVTPGAAYNRRTRSIGFAAQWEWALDTARRAGPVLALPLPMAAEVAREAFAPADSIVATRGSGGAKLVRSSRKRWTRKHEEGFLGALAETANVARAADAVGFSAGSAYRRRYSTPGFALAWERAIGVGRARIEAMLVEAAGASLDPAAIDPPEGVARVSVSEAIAIVRLLQKSGQGAAAGGELESDAAAQMEVEESTERILSRLKKIAERTRREKLAAGWSEVEEGVFVPPGWVRAEEAVCAGCGGPPRLTFGPDSG